MKFFLPKARDEAEQTKIYDAIRLFASETLKWQFTPRRIFSIRYAHNGSQALAQVGERDIDGETVLAIFESVCYVVCTFNRGGFRGDPILIGRTEASSVEFFEEPA